MGEISKPCFDAVNDVDILQFHNLFCALLQDFARNSRRLEVVDQRHLDEKRAREGDGDDLFETLVHYFKNNYANDKDSKLYRIMVKRGQDGTR